MVSLLTCTQKRQRLEGAPDPLCMLMGTGFWGRLLGTGFRQKPGERHNRVLGAEPSACRPPPFRVDSLAWFCLTSPNQGCVHSFWLVGWSSFSDVHINQPADVANGFCFPGPEAKQHVKSTLTPPPPHEKQSVDTSMSLLKPSLCKL